MRVALMTLFALLLLAAPAPARAEDRIDRAAEGVLASPVYVHPELTYLIPEADRALIVTQLRAANVPFDVKVVALPSVEADESGGEADRMLWAIDDRLPKMPRLLIGVDQRGNLELLLARLDRDLDVPYEIEYGASGDESYKTIVPRLRGVFQLAAAAEPRGYTYQRDRPTDPLEPLAEDRRDLDDEIEDDSDDGAAAWLVLVGAGIGGLFTGLVVWGFSRAYRALRHAA